MQRLWSHIRGAVPSDREQVPELQVIQHPSDLKQETIVRVLLFNNRHDNGSRELLSSQSSTPDPSK
jgi:hypothetical protein